MPGNSRTAIRDTILPRGGGPDGKSPIFVAKGTNVQYSVFTMHRREDLYGPDAAEFKPERWETLRPGWEYLPFNGGPRICLGRECSPLLFLCVISYGKHGKGLTGTNVSGSEQFALTEASYTTIRLMQHFRTIESRDPNPWRELLTVTMSSGHGTKVALGN